MSDKGRMEAARQAGNLAKDMEVNFSQNVIFFNKYFSLFRVRKKRRRRPPPAPEHCSRVT